MTKLILTKTREHTTEIKQSRIKRDWMDNTYNKHAYQCLPMTVANVYGWELNLEEDLIVQWDGGNTSPTILSGEKTSSGRVQAVSSIIGMISINMGWVINTDEGYSTWISGSPNYFLDGAVPLTATIPSFWWPDESQMNWKITKIGEPVIFRAGEPFCFFNIYDNRAMQDVKIQVKHLWEDAELLQSRMNYSDLKMQNMRDKPWEWTKGIKTGVDADGKRIGEPFKGLPRLPEPGTVEVSSSFSTDYLLKGVDEYKFELTFSTPLGDESHIMFLNEDKSVELAYMRGGMEFARVKSKESSIVSTGSSYSQNLDALFDVDVPMTTTIKLSLFINSGSKRVTGTAQIGDFLTVNINGKIL